MKVLLYRYGSICEPDIILGFKEIGFEVTEITKEMEDKNFDFAKSTKYVSQFLLDHPHDFVFSINFFPQLSDICNIFKIPYICWIVDSPVMELYTRQIQNSCNRVFLFDKALYNEIEPLNPGHVFHYPLAVNTRDKQHVIQTASLGTRKKFSADVSFVGSLYTEKCAYDKLKDAPEYLTGYLDGIMQAQLKVYGYYFIEELLSDEIIDTFKKYMPNYYTSPFDNFLTDRITTSQLYIGNKITALERVETMRILSNYFNVDIYTGSDTSMLPKIHNRGFAKTLTEMPIIFHESKINLNTTSKSIRTAMPLRVFDIMGCEGFMLSNYQTELFDVFEPGVHFDYYTSMDELVEKTDYYLHHDAERCEIAHNAFEKVSTEYNYPVRLATLMEIAYGIVK